MRYTFQVIERRAEHEEESNNIYSVVHSDEIGI